MDLLEVKSRVAEALVESIFRRARYTVEPFRHEAALPLRLGREDFSPDFAIRMPVATNREERLRRARVGRGPAECTAPSALPRYARAVGLRGLASTPAHFSGEGRRVGAGVKMNVSHGVYASVKRQ